MQKMNWGPVWFALVVIVVMAAGAVLHKPEPVPTRAERRAEQLADMAKLEAWHCEMTGHPSHEAELAGYVCP